MEQKACKVLSIDAWRSADGEWDWNDWHATGHEYPFDKLDATPRAILAWMRANGLLTASSAGRVAIVDDGYNIVVIAKGIREPLFAIEYGPHL